MPLRPCPRLWRPSSPAVWASRFILEIIRLAAEKGVEVELLTSGMLPTEAMVHRIPDAGLTRLWISIDDPETDASINAGSVHGELDHSGHNSSGRGLCCP